MGKKSRAKRERLVVADPPWTPFERAVYPPGVKRDPEWRASWINSRYQVDVSELKPNVAGMPNMTVLAIKRRDKNWIHDWREIQRIKNEILGPEWEGVELYPAESRLADSANQYWLWCLPPGAPFPFGFTDGRIVSEVSVRNPVGGMSRQRPFDEDNRPADLETPETAQRRLDQAGKVGYVAFVDDGRR